MSNCRMSNHRRTSGRRRGFGGQKRRAAQGGGTFSRSRAMGEQARGVVVSWSFEGRGEAWTGADGRFFGGCAG